MGLWVELQDVSRFRRAKALAAYVGLTPSQYSRADASTVNILLALVASRASVARRHSPEADSTSSRPSNRKKASREAGAGVWDVSISKDVLNFSSVGCDGARRSV